MSELNITPPIQNTSLEKGFREKLPSDLTAEWGPVIINGLERIIRFKDHKREFIEKSVINLNLLQAVPSVIWQPEDNSLLRGAQVEFSIHDSWDQPEVPSEFYVSMTSKNRILLLTVSSPRFFGSNSPQEPVRMPVIGIRESRQLKGDFVGKSLISIAD